MTTLRFGLAGTGHWARVTHAPALAATPGIEFTAVWGRSPAATAELAASYRATPYDDLDAFLAGVDSVAFAVPPDVQADIAIRAAKQGKHLLLEKPIALTESAAAELVAAVEAAGVASVVFFTARFQPEVRDWLGHVTASTGWMGGTSLWLGTALQDSSPFNTPWRHHRGALWDVAPHVLSLLSASLGPVTSVTAQAGPADVTHLVLRHGSGVTSTATVTLSAPPEAAVAEVLVWGRAGRSVAPMRAVRPVPALRIALSELASAAAGGPGKSSTATSGRPSHPCDVRFGQAIVTMLASAQRQLE